MKRFILTILLSSACSSSLMQQTSNSSEMQSYVGPDNLESTIYAERLYFISDLEITSLKVYFISKEEERNIMAYHTWSLDLVRNQQVEIKEELSQFNDQPQLRLKHIQRRIKELGQESTAESQFLDCFRFPQWDFVVFKVFVDCAFGGRNFGCNLGNQKPFHKVFLFKGFGV